MIGITTYCHFIHNIGLTVPNQYLWTLEPSDNTIVQTYGCNFGIVRLRRFASAHFVKGQFTLQWRSATVGQEV